MAVHQTFTQYSPNSVVTLRFLAVRLMAECLSEVLIEVCHLFTAIYITFIHLEVFQMHLDCATS